ncbi:MAG: hypothetical protein ABIW47_12290, partial [Ginsengibacter sp.]
MNHSLKGIMKFAFLFIITQLLFTSINAQYKKFTISPNGDTLNAIDQNNKKEGKWVIHVDPLRGERGYEEEGIFVNDKKEGQWRKYTPSGDFIALENYQYGDKNGLCQYFSAYGDLLREENWRAYNPNSPYDTIPVYGTGNNEIISFKVVKAEPYAIKHGTWTYYDPTTGRIIKTENYEFNRLLNAPKTEIVKEEPLKKIKPAEVLEYEKK